MEKLLLIGGFGFIGKNIIEVLYNKYELYVIGREEDEFFLEQYADIIFYEYIFLKDTGIDKIIKTINPAYIINLISIVTANRNIAQFKYMIDINASVLLELYEASNKCENLKFFLHFGSGEEYGNINPPFNEADREYPSSPYALSKQLSTNIALMLYNNYSFPISVVRPGNLFGKYQDETKFIPYILKQLRTNNAIITTKGEQKRDFIYANDFARGIELVLQSHENFTGEIFNLSSGKSVSLKEIIEFCKNHIDSETEIDYGKIPYRENEMMNFELDNSKFENLSNSSLEIDILESLAIFIDINGGNNK